MAKRPSISASELRAFRSKVAHLKKQGLIPGRKIDARSATPAMKRGGESLKKIVARFEKKLPKVTVAPNRPFTLRDLPELRKYKNLAQLFQAVENDPGLATRIDLLKPPGARWAFEIDGTRSIRSFEDIESLIEEGFRYEHTQREQFNIWHKRQKSQFLLPRLKLFRWNEGGKNYRLAMRKHNDRVIAARKRAGAKRQAAQRRKKK